MARRIAIRRGVVAGIEGGDIRRGVGGDRGNSSSRMGRWV